MTDPKHPPSAFEIAGWLADGDPESYDQIMGAFDAAAQPFDRGVSPQQLSEGYTMAGYWYAEAKNRLRRSDRGSDTYDDAKFAEDYLEALVKALDRACMVAMSLARVDRVR